MEGRATSLANLLQGCIDKKAHLAGKLIHAFILRKNGVFSNNTFLLNRLVELYAKCGNIGYADKVFDKMPQRDVYSWNAILGGYCKFGSLGDSQELFLKMPERNTVSWNCLISALVRNGEEETALGVYDTMVLEGFMPTNFTLASVFSACGVLLDVEHGRRCHGLVVKIGLEENMYVGNAVLSMYAKCGLVRDAMQVFSGMDEPNEVTFTAMMGGLAQTRRVIEALQMFRMMCRKGVCVDAVSLSRILGVCAKVGGGEYGIDDQSDGFRRNVNGEQIHGLTVKLGFDGDLHLNNSLLDMYAKNADMNSAEKVFASLPEASRVSWNVMIAGYGQVYQSQKAIEYLRTMQSCGFEPDEVTYIHLLAACVKSGDIKIARQMFDSISCPNVSSWNAILSGYFQNGDHKEAIKLFREMQFQSVQADRTTLAIALSSCTGMGLLDTGKEIHAASQKAAYDTDVYVASGLIGMYSKCGKTELAKHIFHSIPEVDIVCWNSLIAGLSLNSQDKEAFDVFKQMRQDGMLPTQFTYATVLSCCAKLSSSFQGKQIHAQMTKDGYKNDVFVGSALIDMYSKCGDVDEARKFFDLMRSRNTVTWNEMIHGYAQNGRGDEAVQLYRDMIGSGEKPDGITFVAVLTACSHSGLVDAGIVIFNSMDEKYGVMPVVDHYTCIIDALGRAGRFHEAEILVDEMPYKDDPVIWEVLLSSCRVHTNLSLGKRAAEELFRLTPHNSAPYALLANIYSSLGRWDEVRAVRDRMSNQQVIKNPGYSWIEHSKGKQTGVVDDNFVVFADEVEVASSRESIYNA